MSHMLTFSIIRVAHFLSNITSTAGGGGDNTHYYKKKLHLPCNLKTQGLGWVGDGWGKGGGGGGDQIAIVGASSCTCEISGGRSIADADADADGVHIHFRHVTNSIIGHAYLVDGRGKIRWKANGQPTHDEIVALNGGLVAALPKSPNQVGSGGGGKRSTRGKKQSLFKKRR